MKKITLKSFSFILMGILGNTFAQDVKTISFKPEAEESKDAQIWSYDEVDRGSNSRDIVAYEWTKNGDRTTKYGLIDFDIESLPANSEIISATLKLYHDAGSIDDGHSQLSGSNEFYIERVTSDWEESVTWSTQPTTTEDNRVLVPASTSSTQNYNIDLTDLAQDYVDDLSNSYGFLIKIATEDNYRSVVFASGENPTDSLHPELIVEYKVMSTCISLKPGAEESKDAQIWSYDEVDRGSNSRDIVAYEWTKNGDRTTKYGLVDFDIASLPVNAEVISATLKLYHDAGSIDDGHSQLSGSNEFYVERVTSDWEESVTWSTQPTTTEDNRVLVPASASTTQNYSIDLTDLAQDYVDDLSNSYGFLIKIATEDNYRSVVFASGENPTDSLHPELEVCYTSDSTLTSIFVEENNNEFNIFPNPVLNEAFIKTELNGTLNVSVMTTLGTVVITEEIKNNESIDLSSLKSGQYLIKIDNGVDVAVQSIIKE